MGDGLRVSVITTGLVRDPTLFSRSLDRFTALEHVDEIILATWETEAKENAALLAEYSHRYGLIVAAVPEPAQWTGNLLSQMVSLYVGLGHAKKDNYVLKTRTDVYIELDALAHVFSKDLTITVPQNFNQVRPPFDEKVCVWGLEATVPDGRVVPGTWILVYHRTVVTPTT